MSTTSFVLDVGTPLCDRRCTGTPPEAKRIVRFRSSALEHPEHDAYGYDQKQKEHSNGEPSSVKVRGVNSYSPERVDDCQQHDQRGNLFQVDGLKFCEVDEYLMPLHVLVPIAW